ncbi:uncharacterized protein LOC110260074 [Sus scrofa]|uniref:uncharacterized protein LOC110260074 n=1 Tax=Sus scrofa TaxID=9823 RepID=UPI000A2B93E2|nr:uncharacterized protein LOC110260074 [Sus scrofa]
MESCRELRIMCAVEVLLSQRPVSKPQDVARGKGCHFQEQETRTAAFTFLSFVPPCVSISQTTLQRDHTTGHRGQLLVNSQGGTEALEKRSCPQPNLRFPKRCGGGSSFVAHRRSPVLLQTSCPHAATHPLCCRPWRGSPQTHREQCRAAGPQVLWSRSRCAGLCQERDWTAKAARSPGSQPQGSLSPGASEGAPPPPTSASGRWRTPDKICSWEPRALGLAIQPRPLVSTGSRADTVLSKVT